MKSTHTTILNISVYSKPHGFFECLLLFFVIGLITLSELPGISKIMVLYGLFFTALFFFYSLYFRLRLQRELIIYFIWIAWSITGAFIAVDIPFFIRGLIVIVQMGTLIFVIAGVVHIHHNISVIMLGIVIGSIIVTIFGLSSGDFSRVGEAGFKYQMEGFIGNPNDFAYIILFLIFGLLFFWRFKLSTLWYIFLSTLIIIASLSIIYSGSRKGFLGLLAFLSLWYYFCYLKETTKRPLISIITLLILCIFIYYITKYVMSSTYLGVRFGLEYNESLRILLYKEGLNMIKSSPIFGVGLNNFSALSITKMYSHSDYIEVASTTGIIGFVLYFSIYVLLWRRLNRITNLTNDDQLLYIINLFKAAIIIILLLAFGRPNIDSKITWILLAGLIGYSWSIEKSLLEKISEQNENNYSIYDLN